MNMSFKEFGGNSAVPNQKAKATISALKEKPCERTSWNYIVVRSFLLFPKTDFYSKLCLWEVSKKVDLEFKSYELVIVYFNINVNSFNRK